MSTRSLLVWAALVAGAELAARGYLGGDGLACHGGAALFAAALAALSLGARGRGLRRPGRLARRLGLGAAALLLAAAGVDAAVSRGPSAGPGDTGPRSPAAAETGVADADGHGASPARREGDFAIAVLDGAPASGEPRPWTDLLQTVLRRRYDCERRIVVWRAGRPGEPLGGGADAVERLAEASRPDLLLVYAGPGLLDALLEEEPSLRFPAPEPVPRRGSALVASVEVRLRRAARERRWSEARSAPAPLDLRGSPVAARYRALVLAARRRAIDVALLTTSLAATADSPPAALRAWEVAHPRTRSLVLANRQHARLVHGIAGSYGVPAIDTRPGLDGSGAEGFRDLARPSASGRARMADTVADGVAQLLARPPTRCRSGGARPAGQENDPRGRSRRRATPQGSSEARPTTRGPSSPEARSPAPEPAGQPSSAAAGASAAPGGKRARIRST